MRTVFLAFRGLLGLLAVAAHLIFMNNTKNSLRRPMPSQLVYNYAESVYGLVQGKFEDSYGPVTEMLDDISKIARPHKESLLHDVIRCVGGLYNENAVYDYAHHWVDEARDMLRAADMPIPRWLTVNAMEKSDPDHRSALAKRVDKAFELAIVPAVFFMLFSDKTFLRDFQDRVAERVRELRRSEHPAALVRDGVVRRCVLPTWLIRAIFYRDRGLCQKCFKNVSGLDDPSAVRHVDHIVPLALSGSNDPTNFQLLCGRCNVTKGARRSDAMPTFTPYW